MARHTVKYITAKKILAYLRKELSKFGLAK